MVRNFNLPVGIRAFQTNGGFMYNACAWYIGRHVNTLSYRTVAEAGSRLMRLRRALTRLKNRVTLSHPLCKNFNIPIPEDPLVLKLEKRFGVPKRERLPYGITQKGGNYIGFAHTGNGREMRKTLPLSSLKDAILKTLALRDEIDNTRDETWFKSCGKYLKDIKRMFEEEPEDEYMCNWGDEEESSDEEEEEEEEDDKEDKDDDEVPDLSPVEDAPPPKPLTRDELLDSMKDKYQVLLGAISSTLSRIEKAKEKEASGKKEVDDIINAPPPTEAEMRNEMTRIFGSVEVYFHLVGHFFTHPHEKDTNGWFMVKRVFMMQDDAHKLKEMFPAIIAKYSDEEMPYSTHVLSIKASECSLPIGIVESFLDEKVERERTSMFAKVNYKVRT